MPGCGAGCLRGPAAVHPEPDCHGEDRPVNEAWRKAAYYIDDAIHSRGPFGMAEASTLDAYRQRCFRWVSNNRIRYAYFLVITAHCLLAFFEPVQKHIPAGRTHPAVWAIHALCLILYIADTVIHFLFYGCRAFWTLTQTRRCRGEFVLVCLFLIDFVILIVQDALGRRLVAPFRCTRFSMIICKSKSCEHIFGVTLRVSKRLGKIFLVFIIFITIFACMGVHMYANDYHFIDCSNCTNDTWDTEPYTGSFDHIGFGFIRVFGLLTTENYPEIMTPPFSRTKANFIYFALFVYFGNYVLLAILLAIIVNIYWQTAKVMVKEEREQERKVLASAWNIVDPHGRRRLRVTSEALQGVLRCYNPKYTTEEITEILTYLDFNNDGYVDVWEWTIHLCEALRFRYIFDDEMKDTPYLPPWRDRIRKFLSPKCHEYAVVGLCIAFGVLFAIQWYKMSHEAQLAVQVMRTVISAVFLVEFFLTLAVRSEPRFRSSTSTAQQIFIIIAVLSTCAWYLQPVVPTTIISRDYYLGIMTTIATLAVLIRIPLHFSAIRRMVDMFLACAPVMFTLLSVLLVVLYAYSMIGLEAFFNRRQPGESEGISPAHYDYTGCDLGFQTFGCSCLVIFQILVTNDWHTIQIAVMASVDSKFASIFFISCFVVINYIMTNLLVAIAIEAYNKLGQGAVVAKDGDTSHRDSRRLANPEANFNEKNRGGSDKKGYQSPRRHSLSAELQQRQKTDTLSTNLSRSNVSVREESLPAAEESQTDLKETASLRERVLRHRKASRSKLKVIMAFRKRHDQINLHKDDFIEQIIERKEFIHGTTSRGRTGWFPAECVDTDSRKSLRKSSKESPSLDQAQLSRSVRKKVAKKTDWKRDILGNITVMNEEEAIRINQHLKADQISLRRSDTNLQMLEELPSEDSEQFSDNQSFDNEPKENVAIPKQIPTMIVVQETSDSEMESPTYEADAAPQFLSPYSKQNRRPKKPSKPTPVTPDSTSDDRSSQGDDDDIPDWAKKFMQRETIQLRESKPFCCEAKSDAPPEPTPATTPTPTPTLTPTAAAAAKDDVPDWAKKYLQLGTVVLRESRPPTPDEVSDAVPDPPPAAAAATGDGPPDPTTETANTAADHGQTPSSDRSRPTDVGPAAAVVVDFRTPSAVIEIPPTPPPGEEEEADQNDEVTALTELRRGSIKGTHHVLFRFDMA